MTSTPCFATRLLGPGPDPHEALMRLRQRRGAFLLESALRNVQRARWSYVGCDPFLVLAAKGGRTWTEGEDRRGGGVSSPNAFEALGEMLGRFRLEPPGDPSGGSPDFLAGAVGYLGYELGRLVERLPGRAPDDLGLPDMHLGFYDAVLAFDHDRRIWHVSASELPGRTGRGAAESRRRLDQKMDRLAELLAQSPAEDRGEASGESGASFDVPGAEGLVSGFTQAEYEAAVLRIIEHIRAGDIFQANLTQRFSAEWPRGALELYLRLRRVNPAPFAAYYDFGSGHVVSASPELFLYAKGRHVETRPIKGTRPRGASLDEDLRLAEELASSPKDRAELTMIVDLERNDLGRVCCYGSVRVAEHLALETHPTVHHLTSTVTGKLQDDVHLVDLLRATFPGGSVTGAPKIRAMEIIDALERSARGVYTGALGFIGFDGTMELNLPIRTFTVTSGRAYFGVGGGVVADSDPGGEYEETLHKARGLIAALQASHAEVRA